MATRAQVQNILPPTKRLVFRMKTVWLQVINAMFPNCLLGRTLSFPEIGEWVLTVAASLKLMEVFDLL